MSTKLALVLVVSALMLTGCNVNLRTKYDVDACAIRFSQAKTATDSMDVLAYGTTEADPDDCALQYRNSRAGVGK